MKKEFIGSTIGLVCCGHGKSGKMIKVEYSRLSDGSVQLEPVSGHTLAKAGGTKKITAEQFSDRLSDPYNSAVEAQWALSLCGWDIAGGDDVSRKPGRPASVSGQRVNVYLDADTLARASDIGNGNVSEGIRKALANKAIVTI